MSHDGYARLDVIVCDDRNRMRRVSGLSYQS